MLKTKIFTSIDFTDMKTKKACVGVTRIQIAKKTKKSQRLNQLSHKSDRKKFRFEMKMIFTST